jgi:hypothetical protein
MTWANIIINTNYRVIPLPVVLQASKIVQIHNITKKPAKIYVLSLYNFGRLQKKQQRYLPLHTSLFL